MQVCVSVLRLCNLSLLKLIKHKSDLPDNDSALSVVDELSKQDLLLAVLRLPGQLA